MPDIHLRVVGKVQGVGFRWFVCERALELGVAGWVKNAPNGDVEVAARGDDARLAQLETSVNRGPAGAVVTAVHRVSPPDGVRYPEPFRIER